MRLSLGSVGALTAALLIAYALWPDNRTVRGPEQIVAAPPKPLVIEPFQGPATSPATAVRQGNDAAGKSDDKDQIKTLKKERERLQAHVSKLEKIAEGLRSLVNNPGKEIADLRKKVKSLQDELQRLAVEAKARPLSSDVFQSSKPEARISEALTQPVDFIIEPQPLKDAIDFIAARYQIPILIDRKALEEANVDLKKQEVRLDAPGIQLRDLLDLILNQHAAPLGYGFEHGVLIISTIDKLNEHQETIVYDCRDLVGAASLAAPAVPDQKQADAGSQGTLPYAATIAPAQPAEKNGSSKNASDLVARRPPFLQMVISATGTEFWEEGTSISELGGLLIVRQNPRVHERIKRLLASIRLMRKEGAFAALNDHHDVEAKQRAADQSAQATRLSQLEQEVDQLRNALGVIVGKPAIAPTAK